jgi:SpoVK/Ycf46/Vps4 family AAA+-type ATPase
VLGTFLQKLDGFVGSHLFVLATTNDKSSVDLAASRPGRFDQIIDMGVLEPRNYLDLVRRRTQDTELHALFGDQEVLDLLKEKAIVGAFLSNLVKQADISKKTNGKAGLSKKELIGIIKRSHRGFYEDPGKGNIGFGSSTPNEEEDDELDDLVEEMDQEIYRHRKNGQN